MMQGPSMSQGQMPPMSQGQEYQGHMGQGQQVYTSASSQNYNNNGYACNSSFKCKLLYYGKIYLVMLRFHEVFVCSLRSQFTFYSPKILENSDRQIVLLLSVHMSKILCV